MKLIFCLFFILLSQLTFSQKNKKTDIDKWTSALINIECKNDLETKEAQAILAIYHKQYQDGKITLNRYIFICDSLRKLPQRPSGSAIFLKYNSKRYLITAKHVVLNTHSSLRDSVMYDFIFRIPLESEKWTYDDKWIGKLNERLYNEGTYIFSSNLIDIAILSIDTKNPEFGDFLEKRGHQPISIEDIDTLCQLKHGDEIMCVGYPFYSFEGGQGISPYLSTVKSYMMADITTTFGRIAVPVFKNHFFIGDIIVMPGNSGGSMVRNNKLIGIVSSQPRYYIEDTLNNLLPYQYRLPLGINIKSSEIMPLMRQLRKLTGDE